MSGVDEKREREREMFLRRANNSTTEEALRCVVACVVAYIHNLHCNVWSAPYSKVTNLVLSEPSKKTTQTHRPLSKYT